MEKSISGRFKRKSDGKIASIIKTQSFKDRGITLHTIEFEDNGSRTTVFDHTLKTLWRRING